MKQLTKAEEQIIQYLWELKEASVNEILEKFNEPKPAYNTVSTIIRILESKGYIGHIPKGRGYRYFPIIQKEEYAKQSLSKMISGYFDGSFKNLVSFFMKNNNMTINELEDIIKELNKDS